MILLSMMVLAASTCCAAEAWEDETRLAENRLPPRAWFGSFPDVESAKAVRPELSPRRLCLDSETEWRFAWSRRPSERPVGFEKPGYDVSGWAVVKVPCSWQAAGIRPSGERFGTPLYMNQPYVFTETFPADETCRPRVTGLPVGKDWTFASEDNPVGSYRRDFEVPADWIGDEMILQFDGVESFFYLWVNGEYVGFSKNSRSPAAFDVTRLVRAGHNTVAVEVYRHSDGSYLECQDMFRLSGIIRSVGLTHRPKDRLADVRFTTRPVQAGVYDGDWALDLAVTTSGAGEVKARAFDAQGREIAVAVGETVFARPRLWSAEEPNLYTLVVSLERDGRCLEAAGFQLGFRQVEIREAREERDRTFLFNGQPVKLKGVNRGETDPRYGHYVPDERIEEDLRLVKRGNFNHIRCSHFPQPGYFYYLCNKLGVYVMDEANLESHGTKYGPESLSHAKSWEAAHVERQASMYEWNKNFPCIVIWSMGNEAGPGDAFKACYRYLKEKDSTRPVQYERNPWLTDLGSRQYPHVEWVRQCAAGDPALTDGIQTNRPVHYPYHINEYAHNFNNACGNLADFQAAIESSTRIMGGAIWDWSNQALEMTYRGRRVLGWGGCFGEKPEEGQGILDGIVTSDRTPEPCYYEAQHVFQNFSARLEGGKAALTNKHFFRDSSAFTCRWTLLRDGERTETGTFDVVLKPQETRCVDLPDAVRAALARNDAELALRVEFVLKKSEGVWPQGWVVAADQLALSEWKGRLPKTGDILHYVFSQETGELVSLKKGGRELLKSPVTLDCFRVPVGGETTYREGRMYFGRARLLDGLRTMRPTLKSLDDRTDAGGVRHVKSVIAYRGARKEDMPRYGHVNEMTVADLGPLEDGAPGLEVTSEWTIAADGTARVKATFAPFGRPTEFSRVGWRFAFASPRTFVDYFACGPHDNYSDRKTGCFPARYAAYASAFGFAGDVTQDAGSREDARYVKLADPGLAFTSTGPRRFAFQVSPHSATELLGCPHPELLPKPKKTELGLYARVRGLGSANCGPAPLARDVIAAGEVCTLEFALSTYAADEEVVGDGLETAAWQAKIDAAAARGGGRVSVPAGRHYVGQLELKSGVELHLEDGCELVGSGDFAAYPLKPGTATPSQKDVNGWCALVFAANATNVSITGRGVIDGRGGLQPANTRFENKVHDLDGRARNLLFASCRGVTVRDVTLRNPAMWNQHYFDCEDVTVENVRVFARVNYNNDGLDIDSCRRVTVRGCVIDSTDDAIVFKTTSAHPCEDVLVENCTLASQATALKFGTESLGDFRRFRIRNLKIRPSDVVTAFEHPCHIPSGIAAVEVSTVDGGTIEDVDIDGIDAVGCESALYLRVGARCRPLYAGGQGREPGRMRRVRVANLTAREVGNYGASVTSFEPGRIADVTLENISIEAKGGVTESDFTPESRFNDRAKGYPSPHGFGNLPAKGLFQRNAPDVRVKNFGFSSQRLDVRPVRQVSSGMRQSLP